MTLLQLFEQHAHGAAVDKMMEKVPHEMGAFLMALNAWADVPKGIPERIAAWQGVEKTLVKFVEALGRP